MKAKKEKASCLVCGKQFTKKHKNHKYCSVKCKRKVRHEKRTYLIPIENPINLKLAEASPRIGIVNNLVAQTVELSRSLIGKAVAIDGILNQIDHKKAVGEVSNKNITDTSFVAGIDIANGNLTILDTILGDIHERMNDLFSLENKDDN